MLSRLRRLLSTGLMMAPLALAWAVPTWAATTLKVIPQASLRVLDPIWTTAYLTRNHGYLVYDTLFALDANFKVQPQMVDTWAMTDNGLTYTFTLRPGLKFHDGAPVTSRDVIASIKRWGARDLFGQKLMSYTQSMDAVNEATFTITLKEPFALVLDALAKPSSNVPFIMPERVANTDPQKQIEDYTGSGPFVFVKEEFNPGSKSVYRKFTDYVPRREPASLLAGGKQAYVDRVEWIYIPDANTGVAAMNAGEMDYYENPPIDLLPLMKSNPKIKVEVTDPIGTQVVLRPNHLLPPFNNPKVREALYYILNQEDYLRAIVGDPSLYKVCPAMFICGAPLETKAGSENLKVDLAKAKQLLKEGGYTGERIVLMDPTDQFIPHNAALVTANLLRKADMNVEVQAMDWSTMLTRRAKKDPIDQGGWNLLHTWATGADLISPMTHFFIAANCDKAWFGWYCDPKVEELREQWARSADATMQKQLGEAIQREVYATAGYYPLGQFVLPTAYNARLSGVIVSPVAIFWNIQKK
jgi:peptide/nickel transport system substrate-binding protein